MCWQGLSLSLHTNCSSETETQNDTHLDGCLSLCYRVGHPWQPFACLILAVILCPSLLWASRQLLPYSATTTVCCMSTCSMLPVLLTLARQINNRGFKNKPNINVACNSLDVDRLNKRACNILKWNHSQFEKQKHNLLLWWLLLYFREILRAWKTLSSNASVNFKLTEYAIVGLCTKHVSWLHLVPYSQAENKKPATMLT